MITVTYHYWVNTVNAAGVPDVERIEVEQDFDTSDQDHAMELAERHWEAPTNYIEGTLSLT